MGDWSFKPWGNDDAADWFQRFWKGKDVALIVDEIERFDPKRQRYDQVRAAAYLLETFGNPYIWPVTRQAVLKPLLTKTIEILSRMIDPPDKDWGFLDMWGNHPGVVEAVRDQIVMLQVRLAELAQEDGAPCPETGSSRIDLPPYRAGPHREGEEPSPLMHEREK